VAIGYVDRVARRLAGESGYLRQAHTLERPSTELAEVLARLIAADRRHHQEAP
jgi:rubrerythrin